MRRIRATFEIKCLKNLLGIYRNRIINLNAEIHQLTLENMELRQQLEESRAKEGKGALEKMIDGIADAVSGIGKMFSTMSPDELKALVEANDDEEDDNNAI